MKDERDSKLVLAAEKLAMNTAFREPDFDALAKRVEAALAGAGATDDALLLPPLPESTEDGRLEVAALGAETPRAAALEAAHARAEAEVASLAALAPEEPPSQREGSSLAELARAALARRDAKDAVDLARQSLAIAAQSRGPAPAAVAAEPISEPPLVEVVEPTIVTERERGTLPPARRARPAMDMRGPWIGVAVAAVGLAAGFGLYLAGQNKRQLVEVPVAEVAPPAPEARVTATAKVAPNLAPTPEVTPDMLPAERGARHTPEAIASEALAQTNPAPATTAKPSVAANEPRGADDGRAAAASEARAAAAPSGGRVKAEKVVLEEEHSAPSSPVAPPSSGPHSTPGLKPAEFNANGGVADRPSTGAAQAAVGAVLGAARSCIAGQPQGSSATLVFGSSGEVTGVGVSGPAEGTPAAACIQSALKKARVQPFAAPSFSLGVTIRPP